jgi:hypothetical protein
MLLSLPELLIKETPLIYKIKKGEGKGGRAMLGTEIEEERERDASPQRRRDEKVEREQERKEEEDLVETAGDICGR